MSIKVLSLLALIPVFGACRQGVPNNSAIACSMPDWRREQPDPPRHVLILQVRTDHQTIILNGKAMPEQDALRLLGESRSYRPSPYLILVPEANSDCDEVEVLARRINERFDCSRNYCYYPDTGAARRPVKVQP